MEHKTHNKCGCCCHKMGGVLVILVGIIFLLGALDVLTPKIVSVSWPVVLILLGLGKTIGQGKCKCCNSS